MIDETKRAGLRAKAILYGGEKPHAFLVSPNTILALLDEVERLECERDTARALLAKDDPAADTLLSKYVDDIQAYEDRAEKAEAERDELQKVFDMRWNCDQRAIKKWQEATGRLGTWPDGADLTVWLMGELEKAEAENKRLREVIRHHARAALEDRK